jgi:hypothetical protein
MLELYSQLKWVHVAAVLMSGTLFFVRGLALHLGARGVMAAPLRYLSYTIDSVLLYVWQSRSTAARVHCARRHLAVRAGLREAIKSVG